MISVCMATYNGAKFIREQIASILQQISDSDELIISDDGSTDGTIEIIKAFNDSRIHLFLNHFHNHILNFEFSLKQASGEYIFLSDQDDVWLPGKVNIMQKYLNEGFCLVCSNNFVTDASLKITMESFYKEPVNKRNGFFRNLLHNHFLGCCLAFNKQVLNAALPFPVGLITHDTWIGLIAECVGQTRFIDNRLIYFRRHSNNTSHTLLGSTLTFREKISYRVVILKGIIKNVYLRKSK